MRDLKNDHNILKRSYFPNVDLNSFDENSKEKIIKEIENDFKKGLIGIFKLPSEAKFAVYTAYKYYFKLLIKLKNSGVKNCKIEGSDSSEWKLIDGIDLIVHIFNPEKRKFYELEKMWSELIPKEKVTI